MQPRRSPTAVAASLVLAFAAAALPLARGAVDLPVELAAAALAFAAFALATAREGSIPRTALPLLGVVAIALLQLVPLPVALQRLSPGAVRIFEASLGPLGLYPAARPLSLDPGESARELLKALACLAAFAAAHALADTRRRRGRVLQGLAGAGLLVAGVVLGLALAGAGALVKPRFPFVNSNHLAACLNLSAFVALGIALASHGQSRVLWALAFATTGAVSFLSLSRGGVLAFVLGTVVFVGLYVRSRPDPAHGPRRSYGRDALLFGGLVAALGIAAYLALDPVLGRLDTLRASADDTRAHLWRPALQVLRDFPLLGVGRGAFEAVFAGYQLESATYVFTHVENEWLQALLDLGIPGGLLLVGTFAWIWIAAARRRDLSLGDVGLLAGTAAVAAHNLVDFSLGILGVAVPFAIAMGLLTRGQPSFSVRRAPLRAFLAAAALLAVASAAVARVHGVERDQARVEAAAGGAATGSAARDAVRWHPADWVPHAIAGVRLSAEGRCAEAMPWLVRAMTLYPSASAPHLGAARCLAGRDDRAARREYRLAVLFGSPALGEAAALFPALDDLFEVAPETPDGLLALGALLEHLRPQDASVAFRRGLDEYGDDRAVLPLARLRARLDDLEEAVALARRHSARFKTDPAGYEVAASALFRLGREEDAQAELERGLAAAPGSPVLLRVLAERAMASRRWSEARRIANEIAPRNAAEVAEKHLLAARAVMGQGRVPEAIDLVRSAQAAQPGRADVLMTLAALCEQVGRLDDALDAVRRAAALPGASPAAYAPRIAALEAARAERLQRALESRGNGAPER